MRKIALFAIAFLFSFFPPTETYAASLIGQTCTEFGTTKLDSDKRNIIACLYIDDPNTTLKWKATTVSNEIFQCPSGQVLMRVENGKPICATFSCRQVYASENTPIDASIATCGADEIVTGGGGQAEQISSTLCGGGARGYLHASQPTANGWHVDALEPAVPGPPVAVPGGEACTEARAICCKLKQVN